MITDRIEISSDGDRMETALAQADKVARYKELDDQSAVRLRLLAEEMMAMMRSITGETVGLFWIEDREGCFQLHLSVDTQMTAQKRKQLLSASSTGRNESAKGFMGTLRDLFDRSEDVDEPSGTNPLFMSGALEYSSTPTLDWEWSMTRYSDALASRDANDPAVRKAWDELEKSVVRNIADEVTVSIHGRQTEMVIYKRF